MFCVDAHFADEKTEVHGAAFNYLAKVTHPGEWWSQDWKPGSQTPECKLLANWKAYVEHLQCSTHCTKPFNSLASFSAFANLMGYIFIPSLLWVSRLKMRTVSSPVGIWPFRLPSLCSVHSPPWHGPGTPPTHPPTWASYPPFLSNYVLNIQVGCQDNHSETTWKANDFSDILQPGWFLF